MNSHSRPSRGARTERDVRSLQHTAGFRCFARAGLVARGVVYGIIGVLALKLALGAGGRTTSQRGALQAIAGEPFGRGLLLAVTVGLAGYALWRLASAVTEPAREAKERVGRRISALASGIAYAAVCVIAVKILVGARTEAASANTRHAAAGVLGWPGGPVIVASAGAVLVGVGIYQGYAAVSRRFLEDSRTSEMSEPVKRAFTSVGVCGHLARMVVFLLIGYGVIKSAVAYAPNNAIGLDGALAQLARSPSGSTPLAVVAAGFIGFALYSLADARYRRI